mgnify:CR=1 FL=1
MVTGRSGSIGNVFFIEEDFWPLNTTLYVKDFHGNDPRFVFHLLRKFDLRQFAGGVGVPTLNRNSVHGELVGVPSLPEQKHIVAILDEAFAGIATAKANAEKNLQSGRKIFDFGLAQSFTADTAAHKVAMRDLFDVGSSKRVLKSEWTNSGVPFYRGREVTRLSVDGCVANELFISEEHFAELKRKYGVPSAGDIVVTAIGTIGNTYVVRESDRFYFKDASVLWLKKTSNVLSEFVNYWLKSPLFTDQLDKGNGATVDTLTIQKLSAVQLDVPSLSQQKVIVQRLDDLKRQTQRIESIYTRKLAALDELKQSLLRQAFSGQL